MNKLIASFILIIIISPTVLAPDPGVLAPDPGQPDTSKKKSQFVSLPPLEQKPESQPPPPDETLEEKPLSLSEEPEPKLPSLEDATKVAQKEKAGAGAAKTKSRCTVNGDIVVFIAVIHNLFKKRDNEAWIKLNKDAIKLCFDPKVWKDEKLCLSQKIDEIVVCKWAPVGEPAPISEGLTPPEEEEEEKKEEEASAAKPISPLAPEKPKPPTKQQIGIYLKKQRKERQRKAAEKFGDRIRDGSLVKKYMEIKARMVELEVMLKYAIKSGGDYKRIMESISEEKRKLEQIQKEFDEALDSVPDDLLSILKSQINSYVAKYEEELAKIKKAAERGTISKDYKDQAIEKAILLFDMAREQSNKLTLEEFKRKIAELDEDYTLTESERQEKINELSNDAFAEFAKNIHKSRQLLEVIEKSRGLISWFDDKKKIAEAQESLRRLELDYKKSLEQIKMTISNLPLEYLKANMDWVKQVEAVTKSREARTPEAQRALVRLDETMNTEYANRLLDALKSDLPAMRESVTGIDPKTGKEYTPEQVEIRLKSLLRNDPRVKELTDRYRGRGENDLVEDLMNPERLIAGNPVVQELKNKLKDTTLSSEQKEAIQKTINDILLKNIGADHINGRLDKEQNVLKELQTQLKKAKTALDKETLRRRIESQQSIVDALKSEANSNLDDPTIGKKTKARTLQYDLADKREQLLERWYEYTADQAAGLGTGIWKMGVNKWTDVVSGKVNQDTRNGAYAVRMGAMAEQNLNKLALGETLTDGEKTFLKDFGAMDDKGEIVRPEKDVYENTRGSFYLSGLDEEINAGFLIEVAAMAAIPSSTASVSQKLGRLAQKGISALEKAGRISKTGAKILEFGAERIISATTFTTATHAFKYGFETSLNSAGSLAGMVRDPKPEMEGTLLDSIKEFGASVMDNTLMFMAGGLGRKAAKALGAAEHGIPALLADQVAVLFQGVSTEVASSALRTAIGDKQRIDIVDISKQHAIGLAKYTVFTEAMTRGREAIVGKTSQKFQQTRQAYLDRSYKSMNYNIDNNLRSLESALKSADPAFDKRKISISSNELYAKTMALMDKGLTEEQARNLAYKLLTAYEMQSELDKKLQESPPGPADLSLSITKSDTRRIEYDIDVRKRIADSLSSLENLFYASSYTPDIQQRSNLERDMLNEMGRTIDDMINQRVISPEDARRMIVHTERSAGVLQRDAALQRANEDALVILHNIKKAEESGRDTSRLKEDLRKKQREILDKERELIDFKQRFEAEIQDPYLTTQNEIDRLRNELMRRQIELSDKEMLSAKEVEELQNRQDEITRMQKALEKRYSDAAYREIGKEFDDMRNAIRKATVDTLGLIDPSSLPKLIPTPAIKETRATPDSKGVRVIEEGKSIDLQPGETLTDLTNRVLVIKSGGVEAVATVKNRMPPEIKENALNSVRQADSAWFRRHVGDEVRKRIPYDEFERAARNPAERIKLLKKYGMTEEQIAGIGVVMMGGIPVRFIDTDAGAETIRLIKSSDYEGAAKIIKDKLVKNEIAKTDIDTLFDFLNPSEKLPLQQWLKKAGYEYKLKAVETSEARRELVFDALNEYEKTSMWKLLSEENKKWIENQRENARLVEQRLHPKVDITGLNVDFTGATSFAKGKEGELYWAWMRGNDIVFDANKAVGEGWNKVVVKRLNQKAAGFLSESAVKEILEDIRNEAEVTKELSKRGLTNFAAVKSALTKDGELISLVEPIEGETLGKLIDKETGKVVKPDPRMSDAEFERFKYYLKKAVEKLTNDILPKLSIEGGHGDLGNLDNIMFKFRLDSNARLVGEIEPFLIDWGLSKLAPPSAELRAEMEKAGKNFDDFMERMKYLKSKGYHEAESMLTKDKYDTENLVKKIQESGILETTYSPEAKPKVPREDIREFVPVPYPLPNPEGKLKTGYSEVDRAKVKEILEKQPILFSSSRYGDPEDHAIVKKIRDAVADNIQYVSQEELESNLGRVANEMSHSIGESKYAIVTMEMHSSRNWVNAIALSNSKIKKPDAMLFDTGSISNANRQRMINYYGEMIDKGITTFVMFDDASYSGEQLARHANQIKEYANAARPGKQIKIKIACAYMSDEAKDLIARLHPPEENVIVEVMSAQRIKSVKEIAADALGFLPKQEYLYAAVGYSEGNCVTYLNSKMPDMRSMAQKISEIILKLQGVAKFKPYSDPTTKFYKEEENMFERGLIWAKEQSDSGSSAESLTGNAVRIPQAAET